MVMRFNDSVGIYRPGIIVDDSRLFRRIEIFGAIDARTAGAAAAEIDRALRRNVRAILLVIRSLGGWFCDGLNIYQGLREYSEAGGQVVAFVQGECASTAVLVAQAADLLLMESGAKLIVHGSSGGGIEVETANDMTVRIFQDRTGVPLDKLRVYCSEPNVLCYVDGKTAVELGWADLDQSPFESAHSFARLLGQGLRVEQFEFLAEMPRRRHLALAGSRPMPPMPAVDVSGVTMAIYRTQSSESVYPGVRTTTPAQAARHLALSTWTTRSIPAGDYRAVCWGNGLFVAVGNGVIATSPDGVTWTSRTPASGASLMAVIWTGTRFLAAGVAGNTLATSTDGITWTLGSTTPVSIYGFATNGSTIVAVGTNYATYSSTDDGSTWATHSLGSGFFYTVVWTGSAFVAVGANGACITSPDGSNWTAQAQMPGGASSIAYWGLGYGGGRLVAGGLTSYCSTSDDGGVTWTQRALPTMGGIQRTIRSVLWVAGTGSVAGTWLMTERTGGATAAAFLSVDAILWAAVSSGIPSAAGYYAAAFNGQLVCAVGTNVAATSAVVVV